MATSFHLTTFFPFNILTLSFLIYYLFCFRVVLKGLKDTGAVRARGVVQERVGQGFAQSEGLCAYEKKWLEHSVLRPIATPCGQLTLQYTCCSATIEHTFGTHPRTDVHARKWVCGALRRWGGTGDVQT